MRKEWKGIRKKSKYEPMRTKTRLKTCFQKKINAFGTKWSFRDMIPSFTRIKLNENPTLDSIGSHRSNAIENSQHNVLFIHQVWFAFLFPAFVPFRRKTERTTYVYRMQQRNQHYIYTHWFCIFFLFRIHAKDTIYIKCGW